MPRNYRKKGNTDEDDFVVQINEKKEDLNQPELGTFIEQLQKDNFYWVKKGRKLTCSLCRVNVQFSTATVFKTEIHTHMKSKRHKKNVESHNLEKKCTEKLEVNHVTSEVCDKDVTDKVENKSSQVVREVEYHLSHGLELTDKNCSIFNRNKPMIDLETTFISLEKNNPVTQASKKFIMKAKDGRNYFCSICQDIIFESLNANEFRHNLWTHINDESHRKKLPNFSKVERDFKKLIHKLSKKLPLDLIDDLKYFEIGPVFQFVRCSLCNVAVSDNLHRLENHITGVHHQNKKEKGSEEFSQHSKNNHTCNWYMRLISEMETQFEKSELKEDIKYIHIGNMPGYVVCSLCSHVVLPTPHYMKVHFESDKHVDNKTANLIKWESTYKTDLMKKLPFNVVDCSAFEENKYGIKCHRCRLTMPPTPYALYCHMKKKDCEPTLLSEGDSDSDRKL